MSASYSPLKPPAVWNWIEQDKWGGNCYDEVMQSPIPIKVPSNGPSTQPQFGFSYTFPDSVPFKAKKNQEEVIIEFPKPRENNGSVRCMFGMFKIIAKDFHPVRIKFKFPAEHIIEESRYDGEIVIEFEERVDNDDKVMI